MKVRLTMRRTLRGRYLVLSALGHFAAFGALTQIQFGSATTRRPIYDQFVKQKDHSIVYYRPPKVKKSDVAPEQQSGPKREAKAWLISPRTVIATAPKPKSQQQILFQP